MLSLLAPMQLTEDDVESVLTHMLARQILVQDGGILGMGPEGERLYGGKNFMDLLSVFDTPPVFTVFSGPRDLGSVHPLSFKRSDGEPAILSLGGRAWQVTHIDYKHKTAHVVPSEYIGRSRWLGGIPHARGQDRRSPGLLLGGPCGSGADGGRTPDAPEAVHHAALRIRPALLCPAKRSTSMSSRGALDPVPWTSPIAMNSATCCGATGAPGRDRRASAGEKRSLVDLVGQNAKQSYDQRFRVLQPSQKAIQESLQDLLTLPELPRRIECFDISHIQGAETVASMVVWENGAMKKSDYRKFQVKTVAGVDDFASMREIVGRRYKRVLQETGEAELVETSDSEARTRNGSGRGKMPSLVLIDGGLGQLHAAAAALEELGLTTQPLASIAKREEVIYLYGQEDDPIVLDRRSPVLHLIQRIRDESHRFAITYHRKRREIRDRQSELLEIPVSARAPARGWFNTSGRSVQWSRLRSRHSHLLWRRRWRRRFTRTSMSKTGLAQPQQIYRFSNKHRLTALLPGHGASSTPASSSIGSCAL